MHIPVAIIDFLKSAGDISLGCSEINFCTIENIEDNQTGYGTDTDGNTLMTGNVGDWLKQWIVIATDQLGDPIIVDTQLPNYPVFSAIHGEGKWEPFLIANSLANFKKIIGLIKQVSKNRTTPVEIENNPITKEELNRVVDDILKIDTGADISFWKSFLETDD
jgi:hypothetical protein